MKKKAIQLDLFQSESDVLRMEVQRLECSIAKMRRSMFKRLSDMEKIISQQSVEIAELKMMHSEQSYAVAL